MLSVVVLRRVEESANNEGLYTGRSTALWLDNINTLEEELELRIEEFDIVSFEDLGNKGTVLFQHEGCNIQGSD